MPPGFKASPSILRETRGGERDPASASKDRAEVKWEKELYKLFTGQVVRIQEALEPDSTEEEQTASVLDKAFWATEAALFSTEITRLLTEAAQDAVAIEAAVLEASFGISIDWTLANAEAAAWARTYGAQLVKGITKTTARSVGETVATWIETPGSTVGELFDTLRSAYAFSESRARNIGVTEVTNSYAEGSELAYVESGIPATVYKPTAHPNCRCWPAALLLPDNSWVVVWRTNRDELVCKRPIDTGTVLGVVAGCRELENMVVSVGVYTGDKLRDARRAAKEAS